jgi:hypothetical protein
MIGQPQTVTRYETKNIEEIRKDDQVLAYDVRTGQVTKRKVTQVFKRQADHLRYLAMTDDSGVSQTFQTTDSHPFWVVTEKPDWSRAASDIVTVYDVATGQSFELHHENLVQNNDDTNLVFGYYVEAQNLQIGDVFLGPNEELTTLTSTWRQDFPQGVNVYNFTVEDDHNYFVIANYEAFQNGAQPVLVHNSKKCETTNTLQDTPDQKALRKLIDEVTLGGRKPLSAKDANILLDWADEVGLSYRASADDLASPINHWKYGPHIHLGDKHYRVNSPNMIHPRGK